jgi:hypothetical protein
MQHVEQPAAQRSRGRRPGSTQAGAAPHHEAYVHVVAHAVGVACVIHQLRQLLLGEA